VRRALLLCLAAVLMGGCGAAAEVREPDLVSRAPRPPAAPAPVPRQQATGDGIRIAIVTHGQAASDFWAIVKNGGDAAARQMDVRVTYRSPDVYSVARMRHFIDEAVATRPDGLVVSIPTPALAGAIRRAVHAGIPVVSINSGSEIFRRLGVLAHVGQEEEPAGEAAGKRLAAAGVRHVLCIVHEPGNSGLEKRCRGLARAVRAVGGTTRNVPIDINDTAIAQRQLAAALRDAAVDGVLTLSADSAVAMGEALRASARAHPVVFGTFDLSPEVLREVLGGRIAFAVDQQAYLQGYLPVVLLTQLARYGLFPGEGEVIPTGPHFVTRATAAQAIRLSQRGIR